MLEGDEIEPGGHGWVQLYLERPIAAAAGDRFVLRLPSPSATMAGGRFADVAPPRHPRQDARVRASLERRLAGGVLQEELGKYPRGISVESLLKASLAGRAELDTLEDSWLAIYAADGTLLAQNDEISSGWGSSEVIWKARADGIYYVQVGGFGGGSFRLLAYERTRDETPVEVQEIFNGAGDTPNLQSPSFAEHVHHQEGSMSDDLDDSDDTDFWDEADWEDQL